MGGCDGFRTHTGYKQLQLRRICTPTYSYEGYINACRHRREETKDNFTRLPTVPTGMCHLFANVSSLYGVIYCFSLKRTTHAVSKHITARTHLKFRCWTQVFYLELIKTGRDGVDTSIYPRMEAYKPDILRNMIGTTKKNNSMGFMKRYGRRQVCLTFDIS